MTDANKDKKTVQVTTANPDGCHNMPCFHNHAQDPVVKHGDHEDYFTANCTTCTATTATIMAS